MFRDTAREDGFTLLEVMFVVALLGTMFAMATGVSSSFVQRARADSATIAVTHALSIARTRAISERRNFEVTFETPDRIRVFREEIPSKSMTLVSDTRLENGLTLFRFPSHPDTPDKFGGQGPVAIGTGTSPERAFFASDGTMVNNQGDVMNASIFVARDSDESTARAITIFGVSGLMRVYKYSTKGWVE